MRLRCACTATQVSRPSLSPPLTHYHFKEHFASALVSQKTGGKKNPHLIRLRQMLGSEDLFRCKGGGGERWGV